MASLKDKMKDECGISAFSLALSIVSSNPELASKVCDLAEQAAEAGLRSDALKEGALQGVEGEVKGLAHDYTLKEQSADMKFKSVVFGGLFDKTAQGDEALRIISNEIVNTGGTVSEGLELFKLIDNMDISSLTDVARVMADGDLETAKKIVDDIRTKLSYYIGTDYSVVTTGNPVKLAGVIKEYEKKIKEAQDKIDKALEKTGGKQLRHIDGDLEKVNNLKGTTVEGRKALAKIGREYGIEDGKRLKERLTKKLTDLKKAKDTLEAARKEKKSLKAAKEYKDALAGDMKIIEDGGNPYNLIDGGEEWKYIKGFNAEPTKRAQQYGQYVLARALLTGGKDLPQEVIDVIKSSINGGVVNYLDEHLTEDWILDEDRTLDELLARAYTNTADLANNGQLRDIYRQRLMSLASDNEISLKDVNYVESLINTLSFAGAGSGFSDILKYENLTRAARNLGIDVPSSRGKDFYNSIVNLFKKDQKEFQKSIAGDFVKLGNGIELTNRQLLELVAEMLGNTNINKLIASDTLTDREILAVAGKYLIGDAVSGSNRLIELFSAAKNAPATNDTRGIVIKTITGQNVDKGAKVGFFDFRRGLKADPSVDMRAKFYDRLSSANTLELPTNSIEDITDNLERKISEFKGGYILVNDSQYKMSKRLTDAVDKFNQGVEKAEDKITIIYPTGGLMGTITSDGGKLIYRTSYTNAFNKLVRNISIRILGESDVDTRFTKELQEKLLGGDVDALAEYNKLLEEDAQKYFGEMLGVGEEAYKEKLQPMLEQATGISFKNYDAITDKTAFWKKVDENFILTTKVNGNMEQEFVTIGDVIKEVDSLTPEQMSSRLSDMYGLEVTAKHISKDGKQVDSEIRDAFLAYRLSETPIELLERKGKLLALLNGGTADNITVNQFKAILQSGDFSPYKDLFFHDLKLSDEELAKHAKAINDMVFNSLCAEAAMNLVKMGYSLPMVNIRDLVYDFLMDRLNVDGNFARAFLYKNGLPDTLEALRGVVNEIMPKDLRFGYDDGFKYDVTEYNRLGRAVKQGKTSRGTVYTVLDDGTIIEAGERVWGVTDDTMNLISSFLEVNTPSVVNGKTVKDLVDAYHIPLSIAEDVWLANFGKDVLGRTNSTRGAINGKKFVQSMINLRRTIPKGTASHELFHAVFGTLSPTETQYFIDTAEKLYKLDPSRNHREANEMLADLFSEYFRTGSFTLPDTGKLQKNASFRAWILQWFQHISDWLLGIDGYEKNVEKLFDDILSGKLKTTTKKAGYKNIDQWNNANISSRKNAVIAPRPTTTHHPQQVRMILTNPGRLDDVISGKITFDELKERLGREFPPLKSEFDLLDESKVDLKNRTYDGLSNDEWRKRYFGKNRTGFNREAGNYDTIGRWQEGGFDPRINSYVDILTDGTIFRDGYRWWGNKASWIDLVDSAIAVDTPSVVNGKTVKDLADEYGVPLFVGTDSWLDGLGAYGTLGRTNVENFVIDGQQVVQTMINLRRQIPKGTAPHELLHSIFLTMAPEDTKYFLDEAKRLYNYDERTANEMLADLFSEYFRTGSFSLPKQKAMFRKSAQEQKFVAWIKHFFGQMAAWLGLVDSYEKEITKLFDDILDGKIKTTKSGLTKEQLKNWNDAYVSGWKSRISFLHRNGLSAEGYTKFDGRVTPESIIAQFIVDTADDFTDDRYDHLIRTLLNTEENINLSVDVPFSMSKSRDKFLLSYLYDLAEREREYYLEKIRNGEIIPGGATSRPGRPLKALEKFMEKLEGEIKKRPKAKEAVRVNQLYEEIKGLEGQDFNDVIDGITGHGFGIPVEIGVFIDKDGKIISIGRGGTTTISPSKDVPGVDKVDTFYHSHPQVGRFSGFNGPNYKDKGDLTTFEAEPYKNVGLINPGGIIVTFKNTDKFRKAADSTINPLLQAITGGTDTYVSRRGTIQAGLITSLMTKEFDKQNWGIYDNIVQKYKNKVKHIVDKYDISDFSALLSGGYKIADADKNALETIGRLIKDEVKQYDLYYITHGPYIDWLDKKGLGDMFNYSNVEDTMGRYLTKGQEQFGFATVKDVEDILPKGVKLNFIGSKDSDIVRAYFGVSDNSDAGMGYDIYFQPSRISGNQPRVPSNRLVGNFPTLANACYIRFNPDNIVQDTDKLFSIMSREDMLLQMDWVTYMYRVVKGLDDNITIKEFVDLLENEYPIVDSGDTLRRLFFGVVDGYYDKSKGALHLFYYNDVKDANNLNPKEVPNVYFDSGYNRPVGKYVDPATGIKYELGPRDFRNLFDRGEEVVTEFVPIEELDKLKEYDRRLDPKWSKADSDETIDWLKEDFQSKGVLKPLKIDYSVTDGKAYLAEGNHRLAAAKELGMKYLPAQVYVLKTTDVGKGIKAPRKLEQAGINYYPESAAPSEIGIKGTINSFDDRGYDNTGYATYNKGEVDSAGRAISDQQADFFKESKFRDENGNLLVLYRGALDTYPVGAMKSDRYYEGIIFMTPDRRVARAYSMGSDWDELGGQIESIPQANEYIRNLVPNRNVEFVKKGDKIQLTLDGESLKEFSSLKEITNYLKKGEGNSDVTILVKDEYGNEYERALIMPNPDGVVRENEGRVYASYALSKNPLVIDGEGAVRDAVPFEGRKYSTDQLVWTARDRGYDGLIIKNIREGGSGILPVADDYIVFSQKQVKGIDNTAPTGEGTWLDNTGYATYNRGEVDSTGRAISDQQDEHFKESQFRDDDGNILTLYRGATNGREETDLGRSLRYRGDGHLKIFLTPSKDIVKYFGGVTKKRGTKLKDVTELEELLNRDETLYKYDINTNFVVRNLGDGQYEVVKQREYFVRFDAPESYFDKKIRENGHEITRTKIGNEKMMDGGKGTKVREDEVMLKGTLLDIDKKLDSVLYPIDPVLAPYNPHYYEVYGLSRNPLVIDAGGAERNSIEFNGTKMTTDGIADWAYDNGYDGAILKNVKEQFYRDGKPLPGNFITDDYVVFSQGQLKSVDNLTPTEGEHWRDNTGYEAPSLVPDYKPRLVETKNQFTQDTYSSLIAMAAVKNGERIPSLGNEEQQLERILNDYYNAVAKATENGKTLSFAEAQKLKIKAGYALDMFEQDYVLPRYKNFLTPQERSELMGLKYGLAVGVNSDSLKTIKDYNDAVLNRYKSATQHIISQSDLFLSGFGDTDVSKEIEKRQEQLMRQGATLKEVDGQVIVVDTRDELFKELQHIPNNVLGLENLKALGRNGLAQLSNEQAYFLLNVVQLAKNMENKTNLIIQTIYKVSPQLARIDFFNSYRLEGGLPRILNNNTLSKSDFISKFNNTTDFDRETKKTILSMIKEKFARNGKLEYDELKEIINDSLTLNEKLLGNTIKGSDWKRLKKEASLLYTSAFQPYTYLKDVPKEVKISIGNILSEQQKGIRQALNAMGDTDKLAEVMDNIYIYAGDGTVKSFRNAIDGEPADINKILFNADNEIIAGADDIVTTPTTSDMSNFKKKRIEKKNKKLTEGVVSNYEEGLRAYMNGSEMVSQAERDLLNTTLTAARQVAKKYTSTNTIAETDNALASINEEIIRRFKADILGLTGKFSKGGQRWDIGTRIQGGIMEKWERVQSRYAQYYSMSDDQLLQVKTNNPIDTMALNMAKYFKEIERRLGSMDGLTGVTTNIEINKAFGHLGQVVMNVKTINGLYSLMSGIEGNQILKFFRFSNPKQLSYVKEFVIGGEGKETVGGYRTYVDKMDEGLNRDWFNKTFATNFTQSEYRKIVQALTGFTIIDKKWKWVESALNFANSSNYLFRTLMSYPGQLITIANQSIAYFLKQKGWEESMGIEDLGTIDDIRKKTGILNGTYNEINWFNGYSPDDLDPTSFYNRYGIPDVDDVYKSQKFYSTDDIETIYAKIDEYSSSKNLMDKLNDWWAKILRNTDAYKDNANNIIDGIFARNFKNLAFTRALQSNNVMRFGTAEQFVKFMASDAPESMKKRLMETLASDSGKHFRNMLGLGFSGLDRAVSGGRILPAWASNILVGLTQLFNFRGAWGQNIARQTNNFFLTAMKMGKAGFSKEGRDAIALYLAKQPEFINFASQLFNDLKNSRRLIRFQDNGRLPDEDNEYDWMDFIEYAADNMQFASQRRQGIQSYGTTRIATDWAESVLKSHAQPDIYKDTYGVGAFFNAMQKNFGRNWKVPAFAIKAIAQGTTNGEDAFWAYLGNEFWKLSFGTLRYMMNEDFTSYGYSTEMPRRKTGIPFVFTGEPDEGDKAFSYDLSNSETWENITNWYNAKQAGDSEAAGVYAMNLWDTAFNSSQLLGTVKGVGQVLNGSSIVPSTIKGLMDDMHFYKIVNPFDLAEAGDIIGETEAGAEIMKYGYYIPKKADDVKVFIDTIIGQAEFRPGNDSFNKSFFNFDNAGHMQNLEESNEKDAPMEMLLNNMKYLRDENRAFVLDENGNKIVTNYWEKHMDEIERKINDEDFLTKSNFNFIYNWVEANNTDPNYMLYKRLIGEGIAGNYIEQKANEYISDFDAINGYKKTEKMSLKNLKDSKYYDWFITALTSSKLNNKGETVPFLEALATLDENALMEADVKIVEKQLARSGNQEAIKKFFSVNDKGEVNLTTKYESFLMEQGRLSNYLREGDLDSFLAETASITKVFKKDDPYGLMTATLLGSRVNMINSSDYLSSEQKAKAINVLFKDNSEFIQTHIPEMISELGDKAEAYITQMNDSLYGSSIITDKLIADNEMNNSKSGRSAAKSASDKIKVIMADLAKAAGDNEAVGKKKYNYNFTPAKLNGSKLLDFVGGKGYTPTEPTVAIQKYTPHANFTLNKDVNRLVNGPKTQPVTKKKLLSKLESDTLKAFEAES